MLTFGLNDLFLSFCIHLTRNIYFAQTSVQTYKYVLITTGQFVTRSDHVSKLATVVIIHDDIGHHGQHPQIRIFLPSNLDQHWLEASFHCTGRANTAGPRFWLTSFILHLVFSQSFSYRFHQKLGSWWTDSPRPRHTTTSCWNRTSRETSKIIVNNGLWLPEATEKHEWPALSRPCVSSWTCQVTKVMVKNNDEPMMTYKCRISWPLPLDGTWNMLKISVPTLDSS